MRIDIDFRQILTAPDPMAYRKPDLARTIQLYGPRYTELYQSYRRNIAYVEQLRARLIWNRFLSVIWVANFAAHLRRCQCGALWGRCEHTEDC